MGWLAILKGLLSLADAVAGYLREGQLLEVGKALANAPNLQRALDEIRCADAARDVVADRLAADPHWLPDHDPNRID